VLGVWCILCLASLGLISIEVILSTITAIRPKSDVRV
jgi:hypothetical protein